MRIRLEARAQAIISCSRAATTPDWLGALINPHNRLLSILLGQAVAPASIHGYSTTKRSDHPGEPIEIWTPNVNPARTFNDVAPLASIDVLRADSAFVPRSLASVLALERAQPMFLSRLHQVMAGADTQPARNRFIDLIGGLEAYDVATSGLDRVDPHTFRSRRKEVLEIVGGQEETQGVRAWLAKNIPSRSTYSLEQRLTRLARHVGVADRWSHSPNKLAKMRNDLAHGVADYPPNEIRTAFDQCLDLAQRIVLSELDLSAQG